MNRTIAFVAIAGIIAMGIAGTVVIAIFKPESLGAIVNHITTLAGIAITAGVTFYGLSKNNEKIEQVKTQTNGTLSKRDEIIEKQQAQIEALLAAAPPTSD